MSIAGSDFDNWKDGLKQPAKLQWPTDDRQGFEGVLEKMVSLSELMGDMEEFAVDEHSAAALQQRPLLTYESLDQLILHESQN